MKEGLEINRGDLLVESIIKDEQGFYRVRQHKKEDIECGITFTSKFFLRNGKWKAYNFTKTEHDDVETHEHLKKFLPLLNNYLRKQKLEKLLND